MIPGKTKTATALRKLAFRYPDVVEDVACKGTALETACFDVAKKSFLFIGLRNGEYTLRFKLSDSIAEIARLAELEPKRFDTGAGGWSKFVLGEDEAPPLELLAKWIDESHGLISASSKKPRAAKPKKKSKA